MDRLVSAMTVQWLQMESSALEKVEFMLLLALTLSFVLMH